MLEYIYRTWMLMIKPLIFTAADTPRPAWRCAWQSGSQVAPEIVSAGQGVEKEIVMAYKMMGNNKKSPSPAAHHGARALPPCCCVPLHFVALDQPPRQRASGAEGERI